MAPHRGVNVCSLRLSLTTFCRCAKVKSDYCDQQKSVADEVITIAWGYVEPLNQLSDVIARLDVLVGFAQVSADAPEPYVRPRLLPKG